MKGNLFYRQPPYVLIPSVNTLLAYNICNIKLYNINSFATAMDIVEQILFYSAFYINKHIHLKSFHFPSKRIWNSFRSSFHLQKSIRELEHLIVKKKRGAETQNKQYVVFQYDDFKLKLESAKSYLNY